MTKPNINDPKTWGFTTKQVHIGQTGVEPAAGASAVPIYATSAYDFNDAQHAADRFALSDAGAIYSRLGNPTVGVFEERMAALEGGSAALAVASGMAAINYVVRALAHAGDHVVASKTIYGGTYNLLAHTLPDSGITTTFVDPDEEGAFARAIRENTKLIYVETLGNPNSNVTDIEEAARVAHEHKIPLVVDSTFTPPSVFRPLENGADIVVHSATKFLGGHGNGIGGIIIEGGKFDWIASDRYPWISEPNASYHGLNFAEAVGPAAFVTYIRATLLRDTGSTLSPFQAFLFLMGLETLSLRMERHTENALKVVEYLASHPKVEAVHHPSLATEPSHAVYQKYFPQGAGSIFTFEIKGGSETATKFIDNLPIFKLVANVGDSKSLVIHPGTTTHSQLTLEEQAEQAIKPNTIRLSIGIEDVEDIIAALEAAFAAV